MAVNFLKQKSKMIWSGLFLVFAIGMLLLGLDLRSGSAHMDEHGYLFVGRQLLSGQTWPSHSYIFGFDLSWYLFGYFDKYFGGLAGARVASVCMGVISLLGYYLFNRQLWDSSAVAVVATLLLASSASHLFVSSIATYDIVAVCLLCWAMLFAVKAANSKSRLTVVCSAVLLGLAVLSKYILVSYLPLIALVLLVVNPRQAIVGGFIVATMLLSYGAWHFSELAELYAVQISGVHSANTTRWDILSRVAQQIGLPIMLCAIAGYYLLFCSSGERQKPTAKLLLLVVFSLPLPLYHFLGGNLISLYKHLHYSLLFLLPIIAWFLVVSISRFNLFRSVRAQVSLFVILIAYLAGNYSILQKIRNGYPDSRELSQRISQILNSQPSALSEDPYIFRYLAVDQNRILQENFKETTWLDNNADGKHTMQDVKDALWDRKYDVVLLTDQIHPALNDEYRKILELKDYELI